MFARLFKKSNMPIRLGRWGVGSSQKIMDRKVELANHDHCGPCPPLKKSRDFPMDNSMDIAVFSLQSFHVAPQQSKS